MKYDFDEVIERHGTFSMKWDYPEFLKTFGVTERFDSDTIPIHTADMDFRCAKPIQDAVMALAQHNIYGYTAAFTESCGMKYYDAVTGWFDRKYGWKIDPHEVIYVNGTIEALKIAIRTFTKPGEGVLINRPIYSPFSSSIEGLGRVVVNSPLKEEGADGHYVVDYEDFEKKAADENTKMFILCHPHNPTGRIWTDEELKKMADICRRHGVIIASDEVHADLIRKDSVFHPLATVVGPEGVISCTALNKTFNLAGLQATNVIIQDKKLYDQYFPNAFVVPNPFTVAATIAAYNEGEEWLEQVNAYLDDNIDWVLNFLHERMPKVRCYRPEGTYILWMDFRAYGLTAEEIHKKIYIDANVVLEGGLGFDPENGAGFERVCVPTRRSLLAEAFERIAKQFEGL